MSSLAASLSAGIDPDLIDHCRRAQRTLSTFGMEQINDLVACVAWRLYHRETAFRLNNLAAAESRIGDATEMTSRLRTRIARTLSDMAGAQTLGLVSENPDRGVVRYAKPVGLVAAITPRTAPIAAVAVHVLSAIKTRNGIIFCPNPAVAHAVTATVQIIREALAHAGAPADIVQVIETPTKSAMTELIRLADLVIASGGEKTVRAALAVGTPGYVGGVGNPPIFVDSSADLSLVAEETVAGKSADYGTSCSAESFLLVEQGRSAALEVELIRRGARVLTELESAALIRWMWPGGKLNADVIGRPAKAIGEAIGLILSPETRCLIMRADSGDPQSVTREKLSPVLGFLTYEDINSGIRLALEALRREGAGHSAGLYTKSDAIVARMSAELPVSRLMVNQSTGLGNTGRDTNGLLPSVVLSCGTWAGTNTNENVTWRNYLNYTTVSTKTESLCHDLRSLFGRHWQVEK